MTTGIAILVLASSVLHALWNFATRKSQGDLAALWLSLATTAVSLVLTVTFGGPLALVLARRAEELSNRQYRRRSLEQAKADAEEKGPLSFAYQI